MDKPTPPTRKCTLCNAPALKQAEPDGVLRCFGHSVDPVNVAKRTANAAIGKASGERQRGLTPEQRGAVQAGVIPIERARAQAAEGRRKREEGDPDPIPLTSKTQIQDFLARGAAKLMANDDPALANGVAALARVALAVIAADVPEDEADDEAPRTFTFETTKGDRVPMAGRETAGGN